MHVCIYIYTLETTRSLSRAFRLPWDPPGLPGKILGIPRRSPGDPPGISWERGIPKDPIPQESLEDSQGFSRDPQRSPGVLQVSHCIPHGMSP